MRAHFSGDQSWEVEMGERKRVVSADDKILCQLLKGFRFSDISETFISTCFGHLAERIPKNYTHFSFMICYYAWVGEAVGAWKTLLKLSD
jgi:hypothetical protein